MKAQIFNEDTFIATTSSNGTKTIFDTSVCPSDGDLVLYEIPAGTRRTSIVENRFGVLVFEVAGVFCPLGWVKLIGVAVGVSRA